MRFSKNTPVYSQVAYDIASQIANGKLKEGQRFSGRSLMSSQYAVSPETIRRAMNLLANMNVIKIQQNVGATVASRPYALNYIEQYKTDNDLRELKRKLKELTRQRDQINEEINAIFSKIMDLEERFQNSDLLKTYEFCRATRKQGGQQDTGRIKISSEYRRDGGCHPKRNRRRAFPGSPDSFRGRRYTDRSL